MQQNYVKAAITAMKRRSLNDVYLLVWNERDVASSPTFTPGSCVNDDVGTDELVSIEPSR